MNKAFLLFLMAPKGGILLAPVIAKKLASKYGINPAIFGIIGAKVALGVLMWLAVKHVSRKNTFLQDKLMSIANFGQLVDETEGRRRPKCHTSTQFIKNALSTMLELGTVFGSLYLGEQFLFATHMGATMPQLL
jgi:hypothetical protein